MIDQIRAMGLASLINIKPLPEETVDLIRVRCVSSLMDSGQSYESFVSCTDEVLIGTKYTGE